MRRRSAAVIRRAWSFITRFVPEGAALLSALIFASYVMGLVRDRIFAQTFGAGPELDAYNAAFVLPELLFDVLVEAGLAAAFIPIFVKLRATHSDPEVANRFGRTILTLGVGVMGVGSLVLFVFAEAFTGWIAPGFAGEQRELYVGLFRVMLVTQVLFAASLTLGQVLLAEQRFFWYGLAPLLYNAGIVVGTVTLGGTLGIFGPAIGAILGAAVHLGSRFIGLRGSSFRIRLGWSAPRSSVREFIRLTIPKLASQPVEPVAFLFFTNVASGLAAGSLSIFNYARNFQSLPVSLVGVAFAIAAFPSLSAAYARGDRRGYLRLFGTNLVSIVGLTVFAALAMVVLGELGIGILLGGGEFGAGRGGTYRGGPRCLRAVGPVRERRPPAQPGDLRDPADRLPGPRLDRRTRDHDGRHARAAAGLRDPGAATRVRDRPGLEGRAAGSDPGGTAAHVPSAGRSDHRRGSMRRAGWSGRG